MDEEKCSDTISEEYSSHKNLQAMKCAKQHRVVMSLYELLQHNVDYGKLVEHAIGKRFLWDETKLYHTHDFSKKL
jgi:hypothetical protein